jgi:CheY-like chemotaxis protein
MHGGSITAHSPGLGGGSRFTVRLPVLRSETAQEPAAAPRTAALPPAHLGILVADDNRDSADTMASMLEAVGYEVVVAYDGAQAISLAEEHQPFAALLDIGMPRRNGYEVCRHLRRQAWGADMRLIALTGWGQEADRRRATEAGFDHHMVKPVEPGAILALLASLQRGAGAANDALGAEKSH